MEKEPAEFKIIRGAWGLLKASKGMPVEPEEGAEAIRLFAHAARAGKTLLQLEPGTVAEGLLSALADGFEAQADRVTNPSQS